MNRIVIGLLLIVLSGCAKGGGGTTNAATQPIDTTSTPEIQPIVSIDYSKVTCSEVQGCTDICDVRYPFASEEYIRQTLCASFPNSATADSLVQRNHNLYELSNMNCRSMAVTQVMNSAALSDAACSTNFNCFQKCSSLYIPQSDQAIERQAAASGGLNSGSTLIHLLENQILREQLAACLRAPVGYIQGM